MSRRSEMIRDRRIRFFLWGSICVIIVLAYFCFHPWIWRTDSHQTAGSSVILDTTSDFLLVVDYGAFASSPEQFAETSFSLAWLNTLQQEVGPVSLLDAPQFLDVDLSKYRCLILTRSVSRHSTWQPKVRSFLERGGTVVMEMPEGELRALASADGKGGIRQAQNITYLSGLAPEYMEALAGLNLSNMTQIAGSAGPLDESTTWMTIDGVPVVYSKSYALGTVVTVDFNYGMLLTSLQQGRPLDDFKIRNVTGTSSIETMDLAMRESVELPLADILERFLIYGVINESMPVVSFWPFFDGMDGALIVSHREEGLGDAAVWMPQYEATFKATSTLFATYPLAFSDDGLDKLLQIHAELGLLFDLQVDERSRAKDPVGMFKFSPVWRLLNVEEQALGMKAVLPEKTPLLSAQSRDGIWFSHYTHAFRTLSTAGFRADASYRSASDAPGYGFSTGFPFMPIDTNGLMFNILEFPVQFPDMKDAAQLEILTQYLTASEKAHHELISISLEPGAYARDPNAEMFETWQSVYRLASEHRHWITSILNYFRFSRARFSSELKTRVVEMTNNHNKKMQVIRIETLAPEAGMYVSVPKKLSNWNYSDTRRGVQRVREEGVLSDSLQTRPVSLFGYERVLVPLTKGFNAIDVIYE